MSYHFSMQGLHPPQYERSKKKHHIMQGSIIILLSDILVTNL